MQKKSKWSLPWRWAKKVGKAFYKAGKAIGQAFGEIFGYGIGAVLGFIVGIPIGQPFAAANVVGNACSKVLKHIGGAILGVATGCIGLIGTFLVTGCCVTLYASGCYICKLCTRACQNNDDISSDIQSECVNDPSQPNIIADHIFYAEPIDTNQNAVSHHSASPDNIYMNTTYTTGHDRAQQPILTTNYKASDFPPPPRYFNITPQYGYTCDQELPPTSYSPEENIRPASQIPSIASPKPQKYTAN